MTKEQQISDLSEDLMRSCLERNHYDHKKALSEKCLAEAERIINEEIKKKEW